ncbi:glucose-1-phosphate adenylyltransferase [Oscillospiraceae bacterium OttesenSCG-928-G22]|nr:glucose-1-phosphate adenylyltransferase [Oscillospiraceae bacterium OttesenSCG-928-G22]
MNTRECIAMVLAGGKGERLLTLTKSMAKPTIPFGGGYHIIDFTLSNCVHSGVETIGILSQYMAEGIHDYVRCVEFPETGRKLEPVMLPSGKRTYAGTADAIYQNIDFIEKNYPEHVLILAGDHIYKMDYRPMLAFHSDSGADVTMAATSVPWESASRFGIIHAEETGAITEFEEKPRTATSNLASMGIYIFRREALLRYLKRDAKNDESKHDFGKDILPAMLRDGRPMAAYRHRGYWRDVGEVVSLWDANMDLLRDEPKFDLWDDDWRIFTSAPLLPFFYTSDKASVKQSIVNGGSTIMGTVERSVLSHSVVIDEGAEVINSVLMPHTYIGRNAKIKNAIVGPYARVMDRVEIGESTMSMPGLVYCGNGVSLVSPRTELGECERENLYAYYPRVTDPFSGIRYPKSRKPQENFAVIEL